MPIDWKSVDTFERLLASMVAAQDMKLDYRKIASYFGQGATYDSIEGRFRIIKRLAKTLTEEIESGTRPGAPSRGTPATANTSFASNSPTPRKSKPRAPPKKKTASTVVKTEDGEAAAAAGTKVLGGRVGKNGAPSKKARMVKEEQLGENEEFWATNGDAEDEGELVLPGMGVGVEAWFAEHEDDMEMGLRYEGAQI